MEISEGVGLLLAAFVTAAITIITTVITIRSQLRQIREQIRHEFARERQQLLRTQLTEFYDPIFTLLSINQDVFWKAGPNAVTRHDPPHIQEEKKMVWDKLVETVLLPNNQKVCDIIQSKLHLLSDKDTTAPYLQFTTHAHTYKVFREKRFEGYAGQFLYPSEFLENVKIHRQQLYEQLGQVSGWERRD